MLTPNDIADRLQELASEKFPGEEIYRELVPRDFKRPCNLIGLDNCEVDVGYGSNLVELQPTIIMTTFVETDEYHHSHLAAMHARQATLAGLLLPGYIKVGDRAPKVIKLVLAGGYDYDTVTATFSYALDRGEFMDILRLPMMGQLHLNEEMST